MLLAAIICHHNYFADLSGIFERSKPPPKHVRGVYIYRFWRLKNKSLPKHQNMGVSKNRGFYPKMDGFFMENPIKMDDVGGKKPYFWKHQNILANSNCGKKSCYTKLSRQKRLPPINRGNLPRFIQPDSSNATFGSPTLPRLAS